MSRKEFLKIINKYRSGTASKEEKRLVDAYYDLLGLQEGTDEEIREDVLEEELLDRIWSRIYEEERAALSKPKLLVRYIRYKKIAAALIVLVATGVAFYWLSKRMDTESLAVTETAHTALPVIIKPAGQKAVLTLGNGQKVLLGNDTKQALAGIARQDSGQLVYQSRAEKSEAVQYNTLSTPRGGEFKIVLSDGTKVWLNAGSSIHYPVSFGGERRKVVLKGEAYFEVAEEKDHPFIVEVGKSEVRVLGTRFNIKAYQGSGEIRTTLASGKVLVAKGPVRRVLYPGEQALIEKEKNGIRLKKVNVEQMLAWKNNLFYFDNANIKEIMQELSRWYDVDVIYDSKGLAKLNFSGVMSRYSDIEDVLKRLSLTGTVHFSVKGKKVMVRE